VQLLIIARRRDEVFVLLHADDTGAAAIESRQLEAGRPRPSVATVFVFGSRRGADRDLPCPPGGPPGGYGRSRRGAGLAFLSFAFLSFAFISFAFLRFAWICFV
jgi:hypothetical protein